jgi:hypothetical protein
LAVNASAEGVVGKLLKHPGIDVLGTGYNGTTVLMKVFMKSTVSKKSSGFYVHKYLSGDCIAPLPNGDPEPDRFVPVLKAIMDRVLRSGDVKGPREARVEVVEEEREEERAVKRRRRR